MIGFFNVMLLAFDRLQAECNSIYDQNQYWWERERERKKEKESRI